MRALSAISLVLALVSQPLSVDTLRSAEADRRRALVHADYAALDRLMGEDLSYTHSNAKVDTKSSYLQPLLSGRTRYTSLDPADVQVRLYDGTGVVTGELRSVARVAGKESRTHMRFTSTWVWRDGRWQMVAWQSTRMPE